MKRFINGIVCLVMMFSFGCAKKGAYDSTFSGTLEMTEHKLGSKVSGGLATLSVEEGDYVKAGQLLATMDRYEQTKKDYERAQVIFKQGGANLQSVEYAKLAMEDTTIVSPVDGVVLVKVHEVGETLSAGSPVVVIGDIKDQWVKVFIPEGMINQVQMNQQARVSFDGLPKVYKGHVRYIATKAEFTPRNVQTPEERVTQALAVKIANDDADLQAHPGVAADIKLFR